MGKKVDLNKPRSSATNTTKKHNYSYHQNVNRALNTAANNASSDDDTNDSPNALQKKGAELAMRAAGVPKDAAKALSQNEQVLEAAKNTNVNGTLKMPLPVKILIRLLPLMPALALVIFVVLFGGSVASASGISGSFAYGQTCTIVTVTDTGCDMHGRNCTNIYDGDVELEDYIAGVVAAEVGIANNYEYYKVAAIAARTYFLSHAPSDCTVDGNTTFQAYMDVENSSNSELIKQAVEETKDLILVKEEELADTYYASACVVNADEEYYYVRYGTISLGEANFQKIPKEWDENGSAFSGYLATWYSEVDQTNQDYENKSCPNNHDYGMSQIGALYLITEENYSYEEVIEYYYGSEVEILENEMILDGANGFINPTRKIRCTSPFGYRTHPVHGTRSFHGALDIGIAGGEPIYAAKSGKITMVVNNVTAINNCDYGYGNYILIDHQDGTATLYAHIKYGSIPSSIYSGATVVQGEQIGEVGSTGCSTGNHLHYEVRVDGKTVDPADYLDLSDATGTCRR